MIVHTIKIYQVNSDEDAEVVRVALTEALEGLRSGVLRRPSVLLTSQIVGATEGEVTPGAGNETIYLHNPNTCTWWPIG